MRRIRPLTIVAATLCVACANTHYVETDPEDNVTWVDGRQMNRSQADARIDLETCRSAALADVANPNAARGNIAECMAMRGWTAPKLTISKTTTIRRGADEGPNNGFPPVPAAPAASKAKSGYGADQS